MTDHTLGMIGLIWYGCGYVPFAIWFNCHYWHPVYRDFKIKGLLLLFCWFLPGALLMMLYGGNVE